MEGEYFRNALVRIVNERGRGAQNTLSIDTGLSDAYISQVIAGKRTPSMKVQIKIVKSLGIDYLDFLAQGKKITEDEPGKITLAEIARQRDPQPQSSTPPPYQPPDAVGKSPYEMLFTSLMSQITLLSDQIKELKSERAMLVDALKDDLDRCRDELAAQKTHIHRLNETLDKVNADLNRMKDRMLDAARTGDIHHLEQISGAG